MTPPRFALSRHSVHLTLTLDRPEARNAMSVEMADSLRAAVAAAGEDASLRALVLRGAGDHFCAGGDLRDFQRALEQPAPATGEDPVFHVNRPFGDLLDAVESSPKMVVCVVQGAARGAGFGLACAADLVIARADASFAMPETGLGLPPAQILPFVARRLGVHQARRLALTGAPLDAEAAWRLGLVDAVGANDEAVEQALAAVIDRLRGRPPVAIAETKHLARQLAGQPLPAVLDEGARLVARSARHGDGREGLAAFLAKRQPRWTTG